VLLCANVALGAALANEQQTLSAVRHELAELRTSRDAFGPRAAALHAKRDEIGATIKALQANSSQTEGELSSEIGTMRKDRQRLGSRLDAVAKRWGRAVEGRVPATPRGQQTDGL
jgi:septal ring factor EnvC (AmiA/AmiB activator)